MFLKTTAEHKCDPEISLCWAIHAKNFLANVHGFSPYQLAIGYTPILPNVLSSSLPVLEQISTSDFLVDSLKSMSAAKKAFIQSENSERIKRALTHNIRPSSHIKFVTGDTVYYKRNDSKKWKGPAKVIGTESQQILIKHGGTYVCVHPCRVLLSKESSKSNIELEVAEENSTKVRHHSESLNNVTLSDDESVFSPADDILLDNEHSNLQGIEEREISNSAPQRTIPNVKKGLNIKYKNENDEWVSAEVLSRAEKATGKYKSHWNIKNSDCTIVEKNFEQFKDWQTTDETNISETAITNEISNIFLSEMTKETDEAKARELENWVKEKVYEEVIDEGQNSISMRWVINPELIDGEWKTKLD